MASIFKPKGKAKYVIMYVDATGRRRKKVGATDKAVTQRIANDLENRVALRREGLIDAAAESYSAHAARPLAGHLDDFRKALEAKNGEPQARDGHGEPGRPRPGRWPGQADLRPVALPGVQPPSPPYAMRTARGRRRSTILSARSRRSRGGSGGTAAPGNTSWPTWPRATPRRTAAADDAR